MPELIQGFGTPFLLLPAAWLFIVAKRDAFWLPLYPAALGGVVIYFYCLSLNIGWGGLTLPSIVLVMIAFGYVCLFSFYVGVWFGSYSIYDARSRWDREVFFDYVNKTVYKYSIPQLLIVGIAFILFAWFAINATPERFPQICIFTVGAMAATGLLTYALDRNRAEDIRRHFVKKKREGRKLKKRTTLLIAGMLIVLGTIFEIPRGMWLAWLAHVFFIAVWLLVHFRYWRSVYE